MTKKNAKDVSVYVNWSRIVYATPKKPKEQYVTGDKVIAKVSKKGGYGTFQNPWGYSIYEYDTTLKSGFRYLHPIIDWVYDCRGNRQYWKEKEDEWIKKGIRIWQGRPKVK